MSQFIKPEDKNNETINVEGILANFFLKKLGMEELKSDDDSIDRKRKKHKKHKSKKSKNKHKKRSRSYSSESKDKDYMKYNDNYSSSEEKDIQRLQKLKKLDVNKLRNISVSESSLDNDTSKKSTHSPVLCNIPYGPSLEMLLSGVTPEKNTDQTIVSNHNNSKEAEITNDINEKNEDNLEKVQEFDDNETNNCTPSELSSCKNISIDIATNSSLNGINEKDKVLLDDSHKLSEIKEKEKVLSDSCNKECVKSSSRSRSSSVDKYPKSYKHRSRSKSRRKNKRSRSRSSSYSHSRSSSSSSSRSRRRKRSKEYEKRKYSGRRRSRSLSRKRHRSHSRSISRERFTSHSKYKRYRSRSRSYDHSHSRHNYRPYKSRDSSPEYEAQSKKSRKRSRSKSVERNDHKIDKAKIRQLAQKNVLNMIEKGTLPEGLSIENFKKDQLVSMKSGGKSVQELTDFCAKLSKKENDPQEDAVIGNDATDDSAFIHHPFKIKESSSIKMNIKNAIQIPIKTHAEKVAETARLSSQFPVSSGDQHRKKELEWIPVEPPSKALSNSKAIVPVSQTPVTTSTKQNTKEVVSESLQTSTLLPQSSIPALPPPPQPPVFPSLPSIDSKPSFNTSNSPSSTPLASTQPIEYPSNIVTGYSVSPSFSYPMSTEANSYLPSTSYVPQSTPTYPIQSFKPKKPVDVASVVSLRLKALTKLQSNPTDPEALQALEQAQASIQDWVQSQQVPGLFTGSTGAKLMSVQQLSGPKHWIYRPKKDIFTRAAPVTEGKGMSLLKKMGWNPGEGLGKNKEGSLEPLMLDIKTDKKGLVCEGEGSKKVVTSVLKDLEGKHPVSALMELCSKRKWKPPLYTLIKEAGPPHKKLFLFKVEVNNVEYQPASPVNNKKVAKADAAVICLQALSVFTKK